MCKEWVNDCESTDRRGPHDIPYSVCILHIGQPCIQAAALEKEAVTKKKVLLALKNDGRKIMNSIAVPLAAFETTVESLRAVDKLNPLVEYGDELLQRGQTIKSAATVALNGGDECSYTFKYAQEFLQQIRLKRKAIDAMAKASSLN